MQSALHSQASNTGSLDCNEATIASYLSQNRPQFTTIPSKSVGAVNVPPGGRWPLPPVIRRKGCTEGFLFLSRQSHGWSRGSSICQRQTPPGIAPTGTLSSPAIRVLQVAFPKPSHRGLFENSYWKKPNQSTRAPQTHVRDALIVSVCVRVSLTHSHSGPSSPGVRTPKPRVQRQAEQRHGWDLHTHARLEVCACPLSSEAATSPPWPGGGPLWP